MCCSGEGKGYRTLESIPALLMHLIDGNRRTNELVELLIAITIISVRQEHGIDCCSYLDQIAYSKLMEQIRKYPNSNGD